MNQAEQAQSSSGKVTSTQSCLDSTRKNPALDEAASDRIKTNYVQDNTRKNKSSKGKRRTNVVEGDVSHAEEELKELVMDVTGSGGRHTLDDIENAIAAMAGADDTISKKDLNKGLTSVGIEISKNLRYTIFALRSLR